MSWVYRVNAVMTNHVQVDVVSDIELSEYQIECHANKQITEEFGHSDEGEIGEIEIISRPTPTATDPAAPCAFCGSKPLFAVCSVCREPATPGS